MKRINALFDRMDTWRHLPNYQLERRADLFFSLYLPEVLEGKLGFPIRDEIIPEFPIRIGTIDPNNPINRSFKIDYVALSKDMATAVFVELKTEGMSRRCEQDDYLQAAQNAGFPALLEGLLDIFRATSAKRKYFYLLGYLERLGLLQIPSPMKDIMAQPNPQGINEASFGIKIIPQTTQCKIVYVQPNGKGPDTIPFQDFLAVVQKHDDLVSQRFALSLDQWAKIVAGGG